MDFETEDALRKALKLNGKSILSRYVNVKRANVKQQQAKSSISTDTLPPSCLTVFIKNLPYDTNEKDIKAGFEKFGVVKDVRLVRPTLCIRTHFFQIAVSI